MPTREDKERQLRKNVEINVARSVRAWCEDHRRSEAPESVKRYFEEKFVESAQRIDRSGRLAQVWNKVELAPVERKVLRGYFQGVKIVNGKIVRD